MKKVIFILTTLFLVLYFQPAMSQTQTSTDITLTIETYGWIGLPPQLPPPDTFDIIMNTVTESYFGTDWATMGGVYLDVCANYDFTLKCPKSMELSNGNLYHPNASIILNSDNSLTYQDNDFYYIDYLAGCYNGNTLLTVNLIPPDPPDGIWWVDDLADQYTGDILLEITPDNTPP